MAQLILFVWRDAKGKYYASWNEVPKDDMITVIFSMKGDDMQIMRRSVIAEARARGIRHIDNISDERTSR